MTRIISKLPPADVLQRIFDAIADARETAKNNRPEAQTLGMEL